MDEVEAKYVKPYAVNNYIYELPNMNKWGSCRIFRFEL